MTTYISHHDRHLIKLTQNIHSLVIFFYKILRQNIHVNLIFCENVKFHIKRMLPTNQKWLNKTMIIRLV
jgi:hypothetical protein